MPVISIIIPAHNEEAVIGRCLAAFAGAEPGELDVVVVCNGCRDRTASIAAGFGARVVETDVASKANALNLGDDAAACFPRLYLDADVVMDLASVRAVARALSRPGALAAAPRVNMIFDEETDWAVRAFFRFWLALPFIQEGMITAGAYGMSEAGRRRFARFPDVIADDGFARLHFQAGERVEVADAISEVRAPSRFSDLIRIRSRARLGLYQLRARFPEMFRAERAEKRYMGALLHVARSPALYLAAIPFFFVTVLSRFRAGRQMRILHNYVWERDNSSRG